MLDYYPLLASAIRELTPFTEEAQRSYLESAWAVLEEQLRAVHPPLSEAELALERIAFNEAARQADAAHPLPGPYWRRVGVPTAEDHARRKAYLESVPFQLFAQFNRRDLPALTLKAVLEFGDRTSERRIVEAVAIPWFEILERYRRDPHEMYQIDPHVWEEIIAGAYTRAGYDRVELTPRSGDKGRDVIATKKGFCSIRIYDQVKAYAPGHLVPANDLRDLIGAMTGAQNVSKGIITTTSHFAPKITEDGYIKPFLPYRLELRDRDALLPWLMELRRGPFMVRVRNPPLTALP